MGEVVSPNKIRNKREGTKVRPYSLDLRQKIVAAYTAGNTSIRKVAKQFQAATKMDNLSCHNVKGVEEAMRERGAGILYLPPYSPELNLIEMLWSVLKYWMRLLRSQSHKKLQHLINVFPVFLEKSFFKN